MAYEEEHEEELEIEEEGFEEEDFEEGYPSQEDILAAQEITWSDVIQHMTGPVISVIAHVILLALLGSVVIFEAPKEKSDINVKMEEVEIKPPEEIPEPPEPPEEQPEELTDVEVEIDMPQIDTQVETETVETENVSVDKVSVDVQVPNVLAMKPSNSALVLPGVMGARGEKGRSVACKRYGALRVGQSAMRKGLKWLAKVQNPNGSWGTSGKYSPALTGLALLAFLAHGETPNSMTYGGTVIRAIKKLLEFTKDTKPPRGYVKSDYNAYGHAIVAYALSETAALTQIPAVEDAMNETVAVIVEGQNAVGAFDYQYKQDGRNDLSISGWNYQALKAAYAAGSTVPGIEAAIEKSIHGIKWFYGNSKWGGGFGYSDQNVRSTMTAVGVLCLQLLGDGKSSEVKKGLQYLQTKDGGALMEMNWKDPGYKRWHLYQWYYQTQAIFQAYQGKGSEWKKWNKNFQRALTREQEKEGYWENPATKYMKADGHEGNVGNSDLERRIYNTALCCLMLEVYYRYLPTFNVTKAYKSSGSGQKDPLDEEDEIILE